MSQTLSMLRPTVYSYSMNKTPNSGVRYMVVDFDGIKLYYVWSKIVGYNIKGTDTVKVSTQADIGPRDYNKLYSYCNKNGYKHVYLSSVAYARHFKEDVKKHFGIDLIEGKDD